MRLSQRIPAATYVAPFDEQQAVVFTDGVLAPNAAPFEFGERHPLFGNERSWWPQPLRPYMNRAASNKRTVQAASEAYGAREAELLAIEFSFIEDEP